MSEFTIISSDFNDGDEIPNKFGYKFENKEPKIKTAPNIIWTNDPKPKKSAAINMLPVARTTPAMPFAIQMEKDPKKRTFEYLKTSSSTSLLAPRLE